MSRFGRRPRVSRHQLYTLILSSPDQSDRAISSLDHSAQMLSMCIVLTSAYIVDVANHHSVSRKRVEGCEALISRLLQKVPSAAGVQKRARDTNRRGGARASVPPMLEKRMFVVEAARRSQLRAREIPRKKVMKTSVQKGRRWKGVGRGPHFRTLAAEKPVGRRFWRRVGEGYVPAGSATQLQSPRARARARRRRGCGCCWS